MLLFLDLLTPHTVSEWDSKGYLACFAENAAAVINSFYQKSKLINEPQFQKGNSCCIIAECCWWQVVNKAYSTRNANTALRDSLHTALPTGKTQFRKEIGVCINQGDCVSINVMALNHVTMKTLPLNCSEFGPASQRYRRVQSVLSVDKKESSCLVSTMKSHHCAENMSLMQYPPLPVRNAQMRALWSCGQD